MLPMDTNSASQLPHLPSNQPVSGVGDNSTNAEPKQPEGVLVRVGGSEAKVVDLSSLLDPKSFIDPVHLGIMKEPSILFSETENCGHILDRKTIAELAFRANQLKAGIKCPICRAPVERFAPDHTMSANITFWKKLTNYQEPEEPVVKSADVKDPAQPKDQLIEVDLVDFSLPPHLHTKVHALVNSSEQNNPPEIINLLLEAAASEHANPNISNLLNVLLDGKTIKKRSRHAIDQEDAPRSVRQRTESELEGSPVKASMPQQMETTFDLRDRMRYTSPVSPLRPPNVEIAQATYTSGQSEQVIPQMRYGNLGPVSATLQLSSPLPSPNYRAPSANYPQGVYSPFMPQVQSSLPHNVTQLMGASRIDPPQFREPVSMMFSSAAMSRDIVERTRSWPIFFFQHWHCLSKEAKDKFEFTVNELSHPPYTKVGNVIERLLSDVNVTSQDRQRLALIKRGLELCKQIPQGNSVASSTSNPEPTPTITPSGNHLLVPPAFGGTRLPSSPQKAPVSYVRPTVQSQQVSASSSEAELLKKIEEQRTMARLIQENMQKRSAEHKLHMQRAYETFGEVSKMVVNLRGVLLKQEQELMEQGMPSEVLPPSSPFSNPNSPMIRSPYYSPATPTPQPPIEAPEGPVVQIITDTSYLPPTSLVDALNRVDALNHNVFKVAQIKALIIRHKWDINEVVNGQTALHVALEMGYSYQFVKWLCENGADVRIRNSAGETPIHVAVRKHMHIHLNKLIEFSHEKYLDLSIFEDSAFKAHQDTIQGLLNYRRITKAQEQTNPTNEEEGSELS